VSWLRHSGNNLTLKFPAKAWVQKDHQLAKAQAVITEELHVAFSIGFKSLKINR
jgi:hypothetical protein